MGPIQPQTRTSNRSSGGGSTSSVGPSNEPEESFRCQIHQEIERKAKICANTLYECTLPRVESYAYCSRHILQDPKAPYKQCGFTYANGRRCPEPSPRYDAKKDYGTNFCFEHSRQTQLTKTKSTIGKLVPVETTETLLHGLAHHVKVDKNKQHYMGNNTPLKISVHEDDDENDVDVVTPSVDPFVDVDVSAINDSGRIVLDYASDSSTEEEEMQQPTYGSSWKGQDMDNSDNESVDSQCDDPLKHASIYTAEETTRIAREKLSRLQTLYVEQVHHLQHVLRERRRNFLREQRAEREAHCSIYDQISETPHERTLYEKLKGLNRYHRKHGVEAILQRKYLEKRAKATEGLQQKPPSLPKCSYTEGGVKCGERTLPCCKHCRKHILEDKKQVLFRACGIEKSGVVCQEPLAGLFENVTCPLHVELPAQRSFNKRKYDSDSEGEAERRAIGDITCTVAGGGVSGTSGGTESSANANNKHPGAGGTLVEDKKDVKDVLKQEPKLPVVKVEGKRTRSVKQAVVSVPTRARYTRAARAASARQWQKKLSLPADTEEVKLPAIIKQEKDEPTEPTALPKQTLLQSTVTGKHDEGGNAAPVREEGMNDHGFSVGLDEDLLPVNIIAKKKPKLEPVPMEHSKAPVEAAMTVDEQEEGKPTTVATVAGEAISTNEEDKPIDAPQKEEDGKEQVQDPTPADDGRKEAKLVDIKSDDAKVCHSLPEPPSKRRRAAEQRRDRVRNTPLQKGANKEEPKKDTDSVSGAGATVMMVESKESTGSDAEKGAAGGEGTSKEKQPPKGKPEPDGTDTPPRGGGEKSRRQAK